MEPLYSARHNALADALKQARLNACLTQVVAAERLGVTQSWLSKMERGETRISFLDVEDMTRAYKCDLKRFRTRK